MCEALDWAPLDARPMDSSAAIAWGGGGDGWVGYRGGDGGGGIQVGAGRGGGVQRGGGATALPSQFCLHTSTTGTALTTCSSSNRREYESMRGCEEGVRPSACRSTGNEDLYELPERTPCSSKGRTRVERDIMHACMRACIFTEDQR